MLTAGRLSGRHSEAARGGEVAVFVGLTELAERLTVMPEGMLVSENQDRRYRISKDVLRGQYANAWQ